MSFYIGPGWIELGELDVHPELSYHEEDTLIVRGREGDELALFRIQERYLPAIKSILTEIRKEYRVGEVASPESLGEDYSFREFAHKRGQRAYIRKIPIDIFAVCPTFRCEEEAAYFAMDRLWEVLTDPDCPAYWDPERGTHFRYWMSKPKPGRRGQGGGRAYIKRSILKEMGRCEGFEYDGHLKRLVAWLQFSCTARTDRKSEDAFEILALHAGLEEKQPEPPSLHRAAVRTYRFLRDNLGDQKLYDLFRTEHREVLSDFLECGHVRFIPYRLGFSERTAKRYLNEALVRLATAAAYVRAQTHGPRLEDPEERELRRIAFLMRGVGRYAKSKRKPSSHDGDDEESLLAAFSSRWDYKARDWHRTQRINERERSSD